MNILLGAVAALVALAASWVLLKMMFRGFLALLKMATFAILAIGAAFATIHTAELTDPDLGGLKGVFNKVEKDMTEKIGELPRLKVKYELVDQKSLGNKDSLIEIRRF